MPVFVPATTALLYGQENLDRMNNNCGSFYVHCVGCVIGQAVGVLSVDMTRALCKGIT